jgi:hypothetical protein
MKKIIIVGNGASILEKENGELIDSFEKVVRMNDFKTEGYKKYTGSKTDILFTCRLDVYNSLEKICQFPEVILCTLTDPWNGVKAKPEVLDCANITHQISRIEGRILGASLGMDPLCYPSTGLIAIHYFLEMYGHVTITGFDNFKGGNRHYYEEGDRMDPSPHAPDIQEARIQVLKHQGKLTVL